MDRLIRFGGAWLDQVARGRNNPAFLQRAAATAKRYDLQERLFGQNQLKQAAGARDAAHTLMKRVSELNGLIDSQTATKKEIGDRVEAFVKSFNAYHTQLGSASETVRPEYSRRLDQAWKDDSGAGLGLERAEDGSLVFNRDALNLELDKGMDPAVNPSLQEAVRFVGNASRAAGSLHDAPLASVLTDNPFKGKADEFRQIGRTYGRLGSLIAGSQPAGQFIDQYA